MPGVNLNLVLPSLTDTFAVTLGKINTALSTIGDDLSPKIVPSEININTSVPFAGNAATGLGSMQLIGGNVPTATGSVYYNAGAFYLIDGVQTIKLTNAGAINVAGVKGIGGDYGNAGNSASVYYDNVSGEYRFFSGTGSAYGTLVANLVSLKGGGFFAKLAAPTLAANITITLPVLPVTSNPVGLYMGPSGVMSTRYPQTVNSNAAAATGQANVVFNGQGWVCTAGGLPIVVYPVTLPVGCTITGYRVWAKKNSGSGVATQTQLFETINSTQLLGSSTPATGTELNATVAPGIISLGVFSGLSFAVSAGKTWTITASCQAIANTDIFYNIEVYYLPA